MAYKHFSHHHSLSFQQLQQAGAPEIQCSGCKTSGSGSLYICWQCSFFLHEQCFRASRSMEHPSHPSHPLTLVPYPTYPSGSFICNSCNQTGTGFSYTCANCEFDIHVHCAYKPQTTTHESYPYVHNLHHSLPNQTPGFYAPYMPQTATHASYSVAPNLNHSLPNSTPPFSAQYSHMPQSNDTHEPYPNVPNQDNSFNAQYPQMPQSDIHEPYPNIPNTNHSPPIGTPSFNVQYSHMPQSDTQKPYPNIPNTNHSPPIATPSFNAQYSQMPQSDTQQPYPNVPNLNQSHPVEKPSFNSQCSHMPQGGTHEPYPNVPNLNHSHPIETPSFNAQYSYKPETATHESVLSGPSQQHSVPNETKPTSNTKVSKVKHLHFSHQHGLQLSEIQEKDGIVCSGCEQDLSGSAYNCAKSNCNFYLHKSCFELPKQIQHKSHLEHPLILLSSPAYEDGDFTCNACFQNGTAFTYNCSTCKFDLHVGCSSLHETVKREDHEHPLTLMYSSPHKKVNEDENEVIFVCDVCRCTVDEHCWAYCCNLCDFGTHLHCVTAEISQEEEAEVESLFAAQLRMQAEMQRLQLQMQMSHQTAQLMASIGQSMSNLAG
ncbi:uncharacterized protein LOC132301037 [Cornus florida]|uniref:uncharacterized protein LOC132301037 n=1 Tax=Cornus florida TaxID=4283 RepID=UPI00289F8D84|nr:uncharacterized protein LOC132301037 [Cornus florida]